MTDRLQVDVAALARGGTNLDQWSTMARQLAEHMRSVTAAYRHAGGTGEMGEQFDTNYRPGAEKAMEFLSLLEEAVGGCSDSTLRAARNFSDTAEEADGAVPKD
ncbi:hypothetical protein [Saccharopolyspora hordei]|uniref:WXG100 family type VII secretion target n=1 Tax=Saccharopolyspora hordei TaxID=1838 RepID=A0A853AUG1_9PSEU|nr:hypothetical protein [Saccharopolyspora hordei]NYI86262.1 hypothetical protein [Saccharopolyspora hordei]